MWLIKVIGTRCNALVPLATTSDLHTCMTHVFNVAYGGTLATNDQCHKVHIGELGTGWEIDLFTVVTIIVIVIVTIVVSLY